MTDFEKYSLLCVAVQTLFVAIAGIFAWRAYLQTKSINDEQQKQTKELHEEQQRLAKEQAGKQDYWEARQLQLAKRQAYFEIIQYTRDMRNIDENDKSEILLDKVIFNANGLEVIAVAWALKLFDKMVLYQMYGQMFVNMYKQIEDIEKSGKLSKKILLNYPYVNQLYIDWSIYIDNINKE
ncbi:MAG: hypothetical protein Phog2KO_07720 [Phototrophicaceae bacterium]